ncbi:DUF4265 domain-containing protein [Archangium violaceum]|uniref:DUF4265 domain-containing protein n=1 Tax=Archangium violaceum Cb vi76 TaxID=1406225 RepID=A0A084T1V5_9BACT|nr:DUF4265 domain-containing protein [Archangium violaceum]KFA94690.1 hypothetical protein Q664_01280 [Archangium violaceum Cb vi76]
MPDEYVKVLFKLEREDEDYPPVDYERLWARPLEDGLFELDNIPFFVRGISVGDVVAARPGEGEVVFSELVRESGNSTLRVIVFDETHVEKVRRQFQELGCSTELNVSKMLGVDVPPQVDLQAVRTWLMEMQSAGALEFEDACLRHEGLD